MPFNRTQSVRTKWVKGKRCSHRTILYTPDADKGIIKLLKYIWPDMEFEFSNGIVSENPEVTNVKMFSTGEDL